MSLLITMIYEFISIALPCEIIGKVRSLQKDIGAAFKVWIENRYPGLANLPASPPVMGHHIPRFLSRPIGSGKGKIALIVVDGLSLPQWTGVRRQITKKGDGRYRFTDEAVYAWIPTLTAVSRQAIFAGKMPIYFPDSVNTTGREPALWNQFWENEGLDKSEIAYLKNPGDSITPDTEKSIAGQRIKVIGLVINKVDRIMHGMELGMAGMYNQIWQWSGNPFWTDLFDMLLDHGFEIYLTSDHGNVEAVGCGNPREGAVADSRGHRARIYSDITLRNKIKEDFPSAVEWPPNGLPDDYLALLASDRKSFVSEGERSIVHGGAALEEVIVPFVRIEGG